jgi:hypothetical protein
MKLPLSFSKTNTKMKEQECEWCGNILEENLIADNTSESLICYDCYCTEYMELCPLCEEHYEKTTKPEDTYFVITPEGEEITGVQMGIYTATAFPIYFAYLGGLGPTSLHEENLKLIRAVDIVGMLRKLREYNKDLGGAEFICASCAARFSRTEKFIQIRRSWCHNELHCNISERGIIQQGR